MRISNFFCLLLLLALIKIEAIDDKHQYQQYFKDVQRLNDKIIELSSNKIIKQSPKTIQTSAHVQQTVKFRQQVVSLINNQQVEFSYPHLSNIIEIQIKESPLKENGQKLTFQGAEQHYKARPQMFGQGNYCKIEKPKLQVKKFLHRQNNMLTFSGAILTNQDKLNSYVVSLSPQGIYYLYTHNYNRIQAYALFLLRERIELEVAYQIDLDQIVRSSSSEDIFLTVFEGKVLIINGDSSYQIVFQNKRYNLEKFATFQKKTQIIQDKLSEDKIVKVLSLKAGILIQYEKSFDILINNNKQSIKIFEGQLDREKIYQILQNNSIVDLVVEQQSSRQSGYKITILVQNIGLIEFQFGSQTSINIWKIPYGDQYIDLAVKDGIVQIVFSIERSQMYSNYVAQLFLDRKKLPRNPQLTINRFYNDNKDVQTVWIGDDSLALIGQFDIVLYDQPLNSKTLIKQNITQTPYHYSMIEVQEITPLSHYAQNESQFILTVDKEGFSVFKLTKNQISIKCKGVEPLDLHIQILKQCCSQKNCSSEQKQNLCRYLGDVRLNVSSESSNHYQMIKRYLIISLIVAIAIALMIVFFQIRKNQRILGKLRSIKQKLKGKYADYQLKRQNKGRKLSANQRYDLNQQDGASKISSEISNN